MATSPYPQKSSAVPFWRDVRVLAVIGQIIFTAIVLAGVGWIIRNFLQNAGTQGLRIGYDFLNTTAAFEIKEGLEYEVTDTLGWALWVGMVNTLRVSVIGIILTTILAVIVGIARLSNNWLIAKTALVYIEIVRNVPLLVLLFFLYAVVLKLPSVQQSIQPFGWPVYLNQRGVSMPGLVATSSFPIWLAFVVLGLILGLVLWMILSGQEERTGRPANKFTIATVAFLLITGLGWLVTASFSSNQALIAAGSLNIESFEDFEPIFLARINQNELRELGVGRATLNELGSIDGVVRYRAELEEELAAATGLDEAELENLEDRLNVLEDAEIALCGVEASPALINATNQLRRQDINVNVEQSETMAEGGAAYAAGDCDLLVGSQAALAAERAILEDPQAHSVMPVGIAPLILDTPAPAGFNIRGGTSMSPEFFALLVGLVLFTGAFAAEIVRAGILAVSRGQSEAARALGLSEGQRLRLIVLPQALRVIIPPMTSQYLNLTKNSSLAVAIAYPDLVSVGNTVMNNSGTEVQIILLFMVSYLIISLTISAFLNWYNKKVALVER
jgi:general L-amino acid transport system permease protein